MIPGSHNSMTYLKPKKWWMKLIRFTAQCQSKTLIEQINEGCELFDLRIVFDSTGKPGFAHGVIEFELEKDQTIEDILYTLNVASTFNYSITGRKFKVRILNERDENKGLFVDFCRNLEETYKMIEFFGGHNKKDWKIVYEFQHPAPRLVDKYSSWNMDTKIGTGWYLDDLFPRIYAMFLNKHWRKKYKDFDGYLLQDFIGVY